jgi:hypothetical protein
MCCISVVEPGVLFLQAAEFLAHHVILPDPLVDDEECRVDGQQRREKDRHQFRIHV